MDLPIEIPREALLSALAERVRSAAPLVLGGPPGSGKTTLLGALARELARTGWVPVYLDLMGAASSPERFVQSALRALPADAFGARLPEAVRIRRLAGAGRLRGLEAVQALFELWATADEAGSRPVALLLDDATEIRSLNYFPGLREVDQLLAAALGRRPRGTLLATSFPSLAAQRWPFERLDLGPLSAAEIAPALALVSPRAEAADLQRLTCGWPRYVRVLLEALRPGEALTDAWTREMAAGGRLEAACRPAYETLLLRSRGYGMSKAVLAAVADEEGLNLTALVTRLGRTAGAVRDYLQWLMDVDALRTRRKRYLYVDGLLRQWVRLHLAGTPPQPADLRNAAEALLAADDEAAPAVETAMQDSQDAVPEEAALAPPAPRRQDLLVEID